jgi:hypothetical protein
LFSDRLLTAAGSERKNPMALRSSRLTTTTREIDAEIRTTKT